MIEQIEDLITQYLNDEDKENANKFESYTKLRGFVADKAIKKWALEHIYTPAIRKAHEEGFFHIHDLADGVVPYCKGHDVRKLLVKGLITQTVIAAPPRHLSSFFDQCVNLIGYNQQHWAGAMAIANLNTLGAPYVRKDKLTYKQIKQCVQSFVYNLNFPSRAGSQCISEDSKVLTDEGWKKWNDDEFEKILTYNMKTKTFEWLIPNSKIVFDYDGEMFHIFNMRTDQLVNPEHRVITFPYYNYKPIFKQAKELEHQKSPILLPLSAEYNKADSSISDEYLMLQAWVASEGSLSDKYRISITQSIKKAKNCTKIQFLLDHFNVVYSVNETTSEFSETPCKNWRWNKSDFYIPKKIPTEWITSLSRKQAKLYIEEYNRGDGDKNRLRLYCKDENEKNKLEGLSILAGYAFHTTQRKETGVYVIAIIQDFEDRTWNGKIEKIHYKGKLWCFNSKNNTMVTKRDGKIGITGNTPFTNITLNLICPKNMKDEPVMNPGCKGKWGDYEEEARLILKAFNEVFYEGDAVGRPFTFPIVTINLIPETNFDDPLWVEIVKTALKFGTYSFFNYIGSGIDPDTILAMCCRLFNNLKEFKKILEMIAPPGGRWAYAGETGSIGVITLNMAKLGYLALNKKDFFENLELLLDLARRALIKKGLFIDIFKERFMPFDVEYGTDLRFFFRTIGIVGLNEMCMNMFGTPLSENTEFVKEVLNYIREWTRETQKNTKVLWNLEMTPAEGSATRLAMLDKELYPDIFVQGVPGAYYYTSMLTPPNQELSILDRIAIEEELLLLFSGGTVHRIYIGEHRPNPVIVARLLERIAKNTKTVYFDIASTYSICKADGNYMFGVEDECVKCGSPTYTYEKIVGYYRPRSQANVGKLQEIKERIWNNI